jgi:hypothetical protein
MFHTSIAMALVGFRRDSARLLRKAPFMVPI